MRMSRLKLIDSLNQINKERRRLIRYLIQEHELAVGSVSNVKGKCGKPNCRCAQGEGHKQVIFLFRGGDDKRHCKLVRKKDAQRMLEAGQRYREFKEALRQLRAINKREDQIVMANMLDRAIYYE